MLKIIGLENAQNQSFSFKTFLFFVTKVTNTRLSSTITVSNASSVNKFLDEFDIFLEFFYRLDFGLELFGLPPDFFAVLGLPPE